MIEVLEPQDGLLKQFVDSVYVLRKDTGSLRFTAYPTANTPVGLFRDTRINIADECVLIEGADEPNYFAVACNQLSSGLHLHYLQLVDEIAVNFKPLGFTSFSRSGPGHEKVVCFNAWDELLPDLFARVFAAGDPKQQLHHIERFLLTQYVPVAHEPTLLHALRLLNDTTKDYKMQEIAGLVGMHYKQLYREFTKHVGCSLAHYRSLVKFRTSVASKINKGSKERLVDTCYDNGYADQSHFIRQFKKMSGENPVRFFREATAFGKDKVVFRMD